MKSSLVECRVQLCVQWWNNIWTLAVYVHCRTVISDIGLLHLRNPFYFCVTLFLQLLVIDFIKLVHFY